MVNSKEDINLIGAIDLIAKEKQIPTELIIEAIETALLSAYKKDYGNSENARVQINRETGKTEVLIKMDIVEEVFDESREISIEEARGYNEKYEIGDSIEFSVTPDNFGRIAAQTAKQVVLQKIREAERDLIFEDFVEKRGEVVTGIVQRISNGTVFVDIGKAEGILSYSEQVPGEHYNINDRIKVYIMDVRRANKGPQIFLSRSHPGLVKRLFEVEVPEIEEGIVEIVNISREAGSRTKMAVYSEDEAVDAVGSCVGNGGLRVQSIVDELSGEKIDIINWSDDPKVLISNVLKPATVQRVVVDDEEKSTIAVVPDYQLSLAIGKDGQNVRLAAKVSGWKIDIKSESRFKKEYEEVEESSDDIIEDDFVEVE